jgi:hypothetical protein
VKLRLLLFLIFLSGCVSTPEYFNKAYTNLIYTLNSLPAPENQESLLKLMGPYSKGLSQEKVVIESFDGNILEEISRVHIMAVNFPSGPHKMQVGLYRRAGELTAHPMGLTASFKFTALPYTINFIDRIRQGCKLEACC